MSAPNGSEGTRDALLPASPVPERSNVKSTPLESENGQRLAERVCSHNWIGIPSGVMVREEINRIGWNVGELTKYCLSVRNQAMGIANKSSLENQVEKASRMHP